MRCYICDYCETTQSLFENGLAGDEYSQRRRHLIEEGAGSLSRFICSVCAEEAEYEDDLIEVVVDDFEEGDNDDVYLEE